LTGIEQSLILPIEITKKGLQMSKTADNMVELERIKIANIGGSPYILVPRRFRREPFLLTNGEYLYEAILSQAPNSENVVIRIEKTGKPQ